MFYLLDKNNFISGEGVEKLKNLVFLLSRKIPRDDNYSRLSGYVFNPKFKQKKLTIGYVEEILNFVEEKYKKEYEKEIQEIKELIKKDIEANTEKKILIDYNKIKENKISITLPEPLSDSLKLELFNKLVSFKEMKKSTNGKYEISLYMIQDEEQQNVYYLERSVIDYISKIIASRLNLRIEEKGSKSKLENPKETEKEAPPIEVKDEIKPEREERLRFYDLSNGTDNKLVVRLIEPLNYHEKQFIYELIKYNFPGYVWDSSNRVFKIFGDFKQYSKMGVLLRKFGYKKEINEQNKYGLKQLLLNKIKNGGVKKTEYDGQIPEGFKENIKFEKFPFELYEEQKEGIAFLYGRKSAILGDETGVGKTIMLAGAAELKMREYGPDSKTLIITKKATVEQWAEEIVGLLGEEERSKISTKPLKPNKWTIVYYENFSSGSLIDMILETLKNANFTIAIFDELHMLKHEETKKGQNVLDVTKNIPYKWGGSATVSSNKPLDVRYQLQIIGHHLGNMNLDRFKQDFTGMIPSGRGWKEGPLEERIRAAERLNKWLNLTGVYIRRSKGELRDMPNLDIDVFKTHIDERDFIKNLRSKLSTYSRPDMKISELIASREVLASMKVPSTIKKTLKIVKDNLNDPDNNYAASKVIIFTCFVKPGRDMERILSQELSNINPDFKVLTYLGGDNSINHLAKVKKDFTDSPNTKVLIMSIKKGGTGLSFPNSCKTLIVNDFDWTPESAEQSEGRIYRINTNQNVQILYTLVDGLDTDLYEAVMRKRKIAEIVQKYRKEFQKSEFDEATLKQIITYQKQAEKIDQEIKDKIAKANAQAKTLDEGFYFKNFLNLYEATFFS